MRSESGLMGGRQRDRDEKIKKVRKRNKEERVSESEGDENII